MKASPATLGRGALAGARGLDEEWSSSSEPQLESRGARTRGNNSVDQQCAHRWGPQLRRMGPSQHSPVSSEDRSRSTDGLRTARVEKGSGAGHLGIHTLQGKPSRDLKGPLMHPSSQGRALVHLPTCTTQMEVYSILCSVLQSANERCYFIWKIKHYIACM